MSKYVIQCWSCGTRLNLDERNENDGDCIECGVELALDDYLDQAVTENDQLRSELAALKAGQGEAVAFEDHWPTIAAELPEHHRSNYCAGDVYSAERDAALAGWTAHAEICQAPPASADAVSVAPGLERAIQIVREVAKTQPGYSDEREAIFEALSEAYVEAKAPQPQPAPADAVPVPREMAARLCSTDNHVRQTARRDLRNMLAAQGVKP